MNYTITNPAKEAVVADMITMMCYWALFASFGLMLCTIAREDVEPDKMHWQRVGLYRVADTAELSEKERTYLLRPRTLYSRIVDGRTEWRYRIDDEWVYPTAEAVNRAKI